ncbi:MAG: FecR domain-containing protein [Candidatus Brocadiae bacterium]|nr:FecR domain-containing protein [Candidatus Brocadiia bacterium]
MPGTPSARELIGKYLDKAATDAEVAELTRRLREDPEAADAFARACRLDARLSRRFREQRNGEHFRASLEKAERAGPPRRRARRRLAWAAATVAAVAALAVVCWVALVPAYPEPEVTGTIKVREGGPLRRGTLVEAGSEGAALSLGGYCRVAIDPNSAVKISGSPRRERIVLERGRVACDIEPGAGQFAVETEHCTVSVKGTRFAVELLESQGGRPMLGRHVLVKVFAGAVLVAAAGAQEEVKAGQEKLVPGKVVVTAESLAMKVGHRRTYAIAAPDGKPVGKADMAIIGKQAVGANTLYRAAIRFGTQRRPDFWLAVGDDGHAHYDAFGMSLPASKYPLPLKEGMAFEYESSRGKVRARVVRTEAVKVPAGKYACLVVESEDEIGDEKHTRTSWIAPGIGMVKEARTDSTIALARLQRSAAPKPQQGAVALSTFDTDEPLRSPLFARQKWDAWMGEPGRSSDIDIDPFTGGAGGTPFCLRWTYTTIGTWVSTSISPGGGQPADLSKYKGISFYIKGLLGKPCTMTFVAKAAEGEGRALAHIRFPVTQRWQKIIITPDTHPELGKIDLSQVHSIGLTDYAREGAAHNVIWLDEVKLHNDIELLLDEIEAREEARALLERKKTEF